ncbi:hypothetical protein R1sor_008923 [Riccia sorocarpa]|uniref:Endonuclease/exonuclease/phosphatase domain-containing protein n=1 Tax=Riccia sorocarpa TaxID=122646 RepID=A0ABD3H891_9MARC
MNIVFGTYNVRALGARPARTRLKNYIREVRQKIDILAIHEHKLREHNLHFLSSTIWPTAKFFLLPAIDGSHAERNPSVQGGKGGVLVAVNPAIAPLIVAHGFLPLNGGIWLHLDLPDGKNIGFAAIYAPNAAANRTRLWEVLEFALDSSRCWIMGGDFNMITSTLEQKGGTPKVISGEELTQWENFTQSYQLQDTFQRKAGALLFSWDNKRAPLPLNAQDPALTSLVNGGRVLKRLDRIYADASVMHMSDPENISTQLKLEEAQTALRTWECEKAKWL